MNEEKYYTVNELAERWGVSGSLVRRLYAYKEMRVFRLGRTVRIPESEIIRIEKERLSREPENWVH